MLTNDFYKIKFRYIYHSTLSRPLGRIAIMDTYYHHWKTVLNQPHLYHIVYT